MAAFAIDLVSAGPIDNMDTTPRVCPRGGDPGGCSDNRPESAFGVNISRDAVPTEEDIATIAEACT